MTDEIVKENIPRLSPGDQFPKQAIQESVQKPPDASLFPPQNPGYFTWQIASAADTFEPWGKNTQVRDQQLRDFWHTEPYLAGAVVNVSFRNTTLDWEVKHSSPKIVTAVTDMIRAALAGDSVGWVPFMQKLSQDLYTQDNGTFIELIRDPVGSFQEERAPVIGIAHLDSNRCIRTGNPMYPVVYIDKDSEKHKLAWYQVIALSDYPSSIQEMHGVGYCSVTRVLRAAQIQRDTSIFKGEKVAGRQFKEIHFVSGISRQEIKDEMTRGQEEANNSGFVRFILPAIIASLDPEKPVSTATINLASLPENYNMDEDLKWYINCLSLGFGVDYQEFAPLPGGNIGSSQQSMILHRKGSGKNPAVFMRTLSDAFANYGVMPRGAELRFTDKDEQEELERQEVRTGAMEEMAIAVNGKILTPEAAARSLVRRGIIDEEDIKDIPETFWENALKDPKLLGQPVGNRGGNTLREDAGRQQTGKKNMKSGDRLRKLRKALGWD